MHTKKKHPMNDKSEVTLPFLVKRGLIYVLIFFTVGLLLSFFLSIIFFRSEDPNSKIDFIGYLSLYASVIITSFLFKKGLTEKRLLGGLILGIMIFVFTYLISLVIGQNENGVTELLYRLSTVFICVIISIIPKFEKRRSKKLKRHWKKENLRLKRRYFL